MQGGDFINCGPSAHAKKNSQAKSEWQAHGQGVWTKQKDELHKNARRNRYRFQKGVVVPDKIRIEQNEGKRQRNQGGAANELPKKMLSYRT